MSRRRRKRNRGLGIQQKKSCRTRKRIFQSTIFYDLISAQVEYPSKLRLHSSHSAFTGLAWAPQSGLLTQHSQPSISVHGQGQIPCPHRRALRLRHHRPHKHQRHRHNSNQNSAALPPMTSAILVKRTSCFRPRCLRKQVEDMRITLMVMSRS